jgi:hypothetical protein
VLPGMLCPLALPKLCTVRVHDMRGCVKENPRDF